jgi:hypothetical protein
MRFFAHSFIVLLLCVSLQGLMIHEAIGNLKCLYGAHKVTLIVGFNERSIDSRRKKNEPYGGKNV